MTTAVILIVECGLALVLVAAVGAVWLRQQRLRVRRRVVVNAHDGVAYRGVLWARSGRTLILRDAFRLESGLQPVPLDGELLLDRAEIACVQVEPAGGER